MTLTMLDCMDMMADFKHLTFQENIQSVNQDYLASESFGANKKWPKTLTLRRGKNGFGFSLRYFVVEPPVSISPTSKGFHRNSFWLDQGLGENENLFSSTTSAVLDIFFIKDVEKGSGAEKLGLQQGDRLVSVNGDLIGGKCYKDVVQLIKDCDGELKIGVIPHGQDILYTIYQEFDSEEYSSESKNQRAVRMSQPSVNKWAAPIQPRKSANMENRQNSFMEEKKYDPCVSFVAGTPILNQESRSSRSSSIGSSGMHTPLRKSDSLPLTQSSNSSELGNYSPTFEGYLPLSIGQPRNNENLKDVDLGLGVPPQTLNKALRREVYKKSYGMRLAPKMISGVSKPGAVSNIKELFSSGRNSVNLGRRNSATSVLREDFQQEDSLGFNFSSEDFKRVDSIGDTKQQVSDVAERESSSVRLSTKNYQATLIESSDSGFKQTDTVVLGEENIIIIKPKIEEAPHRKRSLLSGTRKPSNSSVENTDDDDSDVPSENEHELNNWEDRRTSYLQLKDTKNRIDPDDENSDKDQDHSHKPPDDEPSLVIKEGPLNRKLEKSLDKKKASARTWKPVYAVLKGHRLFCYKAQGCDADDDIIQPIPLRSSIIEIASDYVKRRHVIRMVTSHGNEYLFQAEDTAAMMSWVLALRDANPDKESLLKSTASIKKDKKIEHDQVSPPTTKVVGKEKKVLSIKKSHFGLRSRRSRSSDPPLLVHPKASEGPKTFGIPIHACPAAKNVKNVPLIVEHCCNVIGDRGKEIIGIYRVPGNTSNIQLLKRELDEKDPRDINWDEEKWYELNNIGSLLKSFLRELPEPIIHNNVYSTLLESNHLADQAKRMETIKSVIKSLPEYHFCTLKFLINHLRVIADNSDKNKMEPKNLAIVFGPTIVRTNEGDLASMVKDMSDQCKIIETLILNSDWMFSEGDEPPPERENSTAEIISLNTSKGMMECLAMQSASNVEHEPEPSGKKNKKFQSLKSNFSMKLRNTANKVTSPKMEKKISRVEPPPDWHKVEADSDSETSGFSETQSPSMPVKNENVDGLEKFKSVEIRHMAPASEAILINSISSTSKNVGNFLQHSNVSMRFDRNKFSPESNYFMNTDLLIKKSNQTSNISASKQDDEDSGITSPQRLDSDDNNSITSESSCGLKEFYDSQSPVTGRRLQVSIPTMQRTFSISGSSADELSPKPVKNIQSPSFPLESEEKKESEGENKVKNECALSRNEKRGDIRRGRKPCDAKRELYSILPGDGNNYEEKMRALLDKNYDGVMKGQAQLEMNNCRKPPRLISPSPSDQSRFAPNGSEKQVSFSLNNPKEIKLPSDDYKVATLSSDDSKQTQLSSNDLKQTNLLTDDTKVNFFFSANQDATRRQPTDKVSALNIITNAIDMKQRSSTTSNSLLSPAIVRKVSLLPMQSYNPQLVARVDEFKHKREILDKKVESLLASASEINTSKTQASLNSNFSNGRSQILSSRPIDIKPEPKWSKPFTNSNGSSPANISLSPNKSQKLGDHLIQVAELLNDSKNGYSERYSNRLRGDSDSKNDTRHSNSVEKQPFDQLRDRTFTKCSTREYVEERNSPLLDFTYSNLNYSKLYPS